MPCECCGNGNPPNEHILDEPRACGHQFCYICEGRDRDQDCPDNCGDDKADPPTRAKL